MKRKKQKPSEILDVKDWYVGSWVKDFVSVAQNGFVVFPVAGNGDGAFDTAVRKIASEAIDIAIEKMNFEFEKNEFVISFDDAGSEPHRRFKNSRVAVTLDAKQRDRWVRQLQEIEFCNEIEIFYFDDENQ